MNVTVEYASVVASGTIGLVTNPAEKRRTLERFVAKYAPQLREGEEYERIVEASVDRTAVYRPDVDTWSGKEGWKAPAHPGAYELDGSGGDTDGSTDGADG